MKRFLLKTIYFSLPILICLLPSEYLLNNYNTVMKQKADFLSSKAQLIEVLILGNSHSGDGVDPTQFDLFAFNAAQGSQSLYYDIEITKKHIDKLSNLKYVLISIDYHSLYFEYSSTRAFMYSKYYDIDYVPSNYSPVLLFNYGIRTSYNLLLKQPIKTEKGWCGYDKTDYSSLTQIKGKNSVNGFNKMIAKNEKLRKKSLIMLENFIITLKKRGAEPIILTLPCSQYYISNLSNEILNKNKKDINYLCKKYKIKSIYYLNKQLPDSFFYNVDHLNKKGAKIVSTWINDSINKYERTTKNIVHLADSANNEDDSNK